MPSNPDETTLENAVVSVLAEAGAQTQWGLARILDKPLQPGLVAIRGLLERGVIRSLVNVSDVDLDIHGVYRLARPGESLESASVIISA